MFSEMLNEMGGWAGDRQSSSLAQIDSKALLYKHCVILCKMFSEMLNEMGGWAGDNFVH